MDSRLAAALALMEWSGFADAGTVDFFVVPGGGYTPSISYTVGTNPAPLVGSDLFTDSILSEGTKQNNGASLALNATLSFTTGNYVSSLSTSTDWDFAAGGSLTITGTVTGLINTSTTLFTGQFAGDTTVLDLGSNNYKVIGASISGHVNAELAQYFGLTVGELSTGGFSLLFSGPGTPPGGITGTALNSGNVALTSSPEPASWVLLCVGAMGYVLGRKYLAKTHVVNVDTVGK